MGAQAYRDFVAADRAAVFISKLPELVAVVAAPAAALYDRLIAAQVPTHGCIFTIVRQASLSLRANDALGAWEPRAAWRQM